MYESRTSMRLEYSSSVRNRFRSRSITVVNCVGFVSVCGTSVSDHMNTTDYLHIHIHK